MNRTIWLRRSLLGAVGLIGALLALAVVLVPYHLWDALSFGNWSQQIARGEPLGLDPAVTAVFRQRPLFYWLQGGLWALLGVDERVGRLLAFGFFVLLAASLFVMVRREDRSGLRAPLALALLLMSPEAIALAAAGLSDIPAAAMVAVTGVVAFAPGASSRKRLIGLVVLAASTGLAKPSVFPALAGLALATLIGPREDLRARLLDRVAPLTVGVAVAGAYLVHQSRKLDLGLGEVLSAGNAGPHSTSRCDSTGCEQVAELAGRLRLGAALEFLWMGPFLRPYLVFALVYAGLRLLGREHRPAALVAAAASLLLPWFGAIVTNGSLRSGLFTSPAAVAYAIPTGLLLALAALVPPESGPSRRDLARAVVWAAPPVAIWLALTPFGVRLLAPGWPALLTLMALAVAPALSGATTRGRSVTAVVAAILLGGLALNVRDLDNLDSLAPRPGGSLAVLWDLARDPFLGPERARELANPELGRTLRKLRPVLGEDGRVITSDGRMRFFFGGRVTMGFPRDCRAVAGHRALLLLTNPVSSSLQPGPTRDPRWWTSRCDAVIVDELPGRYALLMLGSEDGQ